MIILEGCDGTGKTTLAHHLADKFGLALAERGTKNRDELFKVTRTDTYRALAQAVQGDAPAQVWDRLGLPSDFVYHRMMNRPCEFQDVERAFILQVMEALEMPMIVCIVPFDVAVENCNEGHQMKGVNENFREIYMRYASSDFPHPSNTIFYDYTGTTNHTATLGDIEDEVAGYLITRSARETC